MYTNGTFTIIIYIYEKIKFIREGYYNSSPKIQYRSKYAINEYGIAIAKFIFNRILYL